MSAVDFDVVTGPPAPPARRPEEVRRESPAAPDAEEPPAALPDPGPDDRRR